MAEVYDTAKEVFQELFHTGQNDKKCIEQLELEKQELKRNMAEIKTDFLHNLEIIQELESKVLQYQAHQESFSQKSKLLQMQLSDEIVRNKKADDKIELLQTNNTNCHKELNAANRLHDSLVCVQNQKHYEDTRKLEEECNEKVGQANERVNKLELTFQSRLQTEKIHSQQQLSKERHEWNKQKAALSSEIEMVTLRVRSKDVEIENYLKQNEDAKVLEDALREEIKSKLLEINSLKLSIEEERAITEDYTKTAGNKLSHIEHERNNMKYAYEAKLNLMDKQLRIRKLNQQELKTNHDKLVEEFNKEKLNLETLLHQEQVLHNSCREEKELLTQEFKEYKTGSEGKRLEQQKRLVDYSLREEKMLSQIETLQNMLSEKTTRISGLEGVRKESLTAYQADIDRANKIEMALRMQNQKLKEAIKDMKQQVVEMTTDEEKRLAARKSMLDRQQEDITLEKKKLHGFKHEQLRTQEAQSLPEHIKNVDRQKLYEQLKMSVEETYVFRIERDKLLERCNKLQADLRKNQVETRNNAKSPISISNSHNSACLTDFKPHLQQVEDLQYKLTKHQLGIIALNRTETMLPISENGSEDKSMTPSVNTLIEEEEFLDSELSAFPSLDHTIKNESQDSYNLKNSVGLSARLGTRTELPSRPKSARKKPKSQTNFKPYKPANYNELRKQI